ncbi:MAG: ComEC/Rec2 family competence protein [Cyanobacteria bacterium SZAS-4]|nr:ComEC/Rec2 family competence protein [Cyanobacteria bacterium SZAS-4]
MVISNAKVTVLAAALAAAGAILNSTDLPPFIAILWTVACLIGALQFTIQAKVKTKVETKLGVSACTALLLSVSTLGYYQYAQIRKAPTPNDLVEYTGHDVIFIATVNRDDCREATRDLTLHCETLLFPRTHPLSGKTQLTFPTPTDLLIEMGGNTNLPEQVHLRVRGHIYQPRKNPPPWEYDKRKKLAAQGIHSICNLERSDTAVLVLTTKPDSFKTLSQPSPTLDAFDGIIARYEALMTSARHRIVETHRSVLPPKLADLLSSMVLGNRAVAVSEEMTRKFRDVGLSHILAASGFNLTIVTIMSFALCRLVTPSVVLANLGCFLSMLGFVSLAGPSPSVLRAALMCTVMLLTKSGQRKTLVLPALALAFLLTVTADPLCTDDLGLQLSYAATVGIVLGSRALAQQFYAGETKWKQSLADAIAVVLIAQFSVMPIQLYFFWRAGTMFIPANLLVTPLVTPLTMVGFASSALALFDIPQPAVQAVLSGTIALADAVAFIPLTMMVLMVNGFSSFDMANFSLGPPSVLSIILYYFCFLLFIVSLQIKTKIAWTSAAFTGTLLLLLWRPAPPPLTVATVHAHTLLINSDQQAIDIDSRDKPSKILERFFAFNGAKFSPTSFSTGLLKSGVRYVHSQNWLLIMHSNKRQPHFDSESAEILLIARKLQCKQIIVLLPQSNSSTDFLPACEFAHNLQSTDSELKLIGLRNTSGLVYTRTRN